MIQLDLVGGIQDNGATSSLLSRSPYGVRLVEDTSKAFKDLKTLDSYIFNQDKENEGAKQSVVQWQNILEQSSLNGGENYNNQSDNLPGGKTFYSAANYSDTRVGGNEAINPYWQFNRDDDITPPLLELPNRESSGMGRVYAEMYDDNQRILWLKMGVSEFVNIASFYTGAGDANAARAMNTGSLRGILGKVITTVMSTVIWAITFPITAPFWIARWISRIETDQITKYYYFKPAMTLYYDMVNTMLSYLAVSMGIYAQFFKQRRDTTKVLQKDFNSLPNSKEKETDTNGDVLGKEDKSPELKQKEASTKDITTDTGIPEVLKNGPDIFVILNRRTQLFNAAISKVTTRQLLALQQKEDQDENEYFDKSQPTYVRDKNGNLVEKKTDKKEGFFSSWWSSLKGTAFGSNDFIGFRIERGVNCTESVSNQSGPTGIAQKLNAIAQQKKDEYEDAGNSTIAKWMIDVKNKGWNAAAKDLVNSALSQVASAVGIGDIAAILTSGNGFLDIPDVWKGSSFNKSYNFTIQLRARYGDPVSIYQSIYIPLVLLLCAALPRSIGDNMYTSPFLVKAFCKGMFSVPCGLISDMTITRGRDEFGWNNANLPTAVDVNLTIRDLTPTIFLSMQDIGLFDTFTRNDNMIEYLDTLSALGISERLFYWQRAMRKLTAACLIKRNTIFSSVWWGAKMGRSNLACAIAAVGPYGNYEDSDLKANQ